MILDLYRVFGVDNGQRMIYFQCDARITTQTSWRGFEAPGYSRRCGAEASYGVKFRGELSGRKHSIHVCRRHFLEDWFLPNFKLLQLMPKKFYGGTYYITEQWVYFQPGTDLSDIMHWIYNDLKITKEELQQDG